MSCGLADWIVYWKPDNIALIRVTWAPLLKSKWTQVKMIFTLKILWRCGVC